MSAESGYLRAWLLAPVVALLAACSTPPEGGRADPIATGRWKRPGDELARGLASWYGPGFQGRRTASGERFDMNELTAAHRSLPFGTMLRVRNLRNGQEVIVRINDRGPHRSDRIIDLSRAAAARIDLLQAGEAPVALIAP